MVKCFNPYSSGFSIYLLVKQEVKVLLKKLQSLFTWIFYLFKWKKKTLQSKKEGFNPYSPGFSIYFKRRINDGWFFRCFNPYSPGFSIYFNHSVAFQWGFDSFNPYSPGFSIYLILNDTEEAIVNASILIHLDFLSI